MQNIIDTIKAKLAVLQKQVANLIGSPSVLYTTAVPLLGKHITLNDNVPNEVGCAEAVSYVLKQAGITVPEGGIPGTATLYSFLKNNKSFVESSSYLVGAIIVSPTGMGNDKIPGHTGICANYGILSNNSATGLFLETWNISNWISYYHQYGGLPIYYFVYVG